MSPNHLRILLAADAGRQAAAFDYYIHEAGHEVVAVEARGEAALRAARLVHPDLVVLAHPLRGPLDGPALATALQSGPVPVPVLFISNPADLPELLARHPALHAAPPDSSTAS